MNDPTEAIRRVLVPAINAEAARLAETTADPRKELEEKYGQLWDTSELGEAFDVEGFMAPFVVVSRKSDGQRGTLMFSHRPRFYHSFSADA